MIDKETQERIKAWVKPVTPFCPIPSLLMKKVIILKNKDRIPEFEQAYPNFICYRRGKNGFGDRYIDSRTEELWETIIASEPHKGQRYYKAFIDTTLSKEEFRITVQPSLPNNLCEVHFFGEDV